MRPILRRRQDVTTHPHILDELGRRGLMVHTTDPDALRADLSAGPVTFYCGFDPTAPSLHFGNLVQLVTMRRLQLAGQLPLALVGGATGLIGDPKATEERVLNPRGTVEKWVESVRGQVERFLDFEGTYAARMVNNLDWTAPVSVVDFLRDIGKHFPVNRMLDRETVRARLESGISYTEFSYVLLQSMDYLELFRRHGCRLQIGGSDQWGNITAGVELVRRAEGARVHALATPLITKPDGTKYGKTEGGAIWLDPELTSPYAFYQFWLNVEDRQVGELLRVFTFRAVDEIAELETRHAERPSAREAQRALAEDVTTLVHGAAETRRVQEAATALFGSGDLAALDSSTLAAALQEAPFARMEAGSVLPSVVDALVATGLAQSKGAARRTINEGGAYVNNERVTDAEAVLAPAQLLHGRYVVLRKGKRSMAGVEVLR
ncbi:MAG: tyrosine--tRNA ligase [Propionibacteriales bacterium]|nr:tyrosine--tRNA ligase [Propionibacteriales bacterium]